MGIHIDSGVGNQVLGEMRDMLKESRKQSKYMLWLTIIIAILTAIQIILLITK